MSSRECFVTGPIPMSDISNYKLVDLELWLQSPWRVRSLFRETRETDSLVPIDPQMTTRT